MYEKLLKELFVIPRSITGPNNRKTLKIIKNYLPIKVKSVKSGTKVFDWTVPKEWIVKEAWIKNSKGEKIVDIKKNYLNLLNYSFPINKVISFKQLQKYLIVSKSKDRNSIPYRTSYYKKKISFCVSKNEFEILSKYKNKKFHIFINSYFKKGELNYGELLIKGSSKKEILISSYFCHPFQANDSLSGIIMAIKLGNYLLKKNNKFSYRLVFIPETIGSICFIKNNLNILRKRTFVGFVLTTCGGRGPVGIKYSFDKKHIINQLLDKIFFKKKIKRYNFSIRGSDERQYSSPGVRVNIVSIFKDKYFDYNQYHTSKDDLDFVKLKNINFTFKYYKQLIREIERLKIYKRIIPNCEPMMEKYKLYHNFGGEYLPGKFNYFDYVMKCLFYTDGNITSRDVQKLLKIDNKFLNLIYKTLIKKKLIKQIL